MSSIKGLVGRGVGTTPLRGAPIGTYRRVLPISVSKFGNNDVRIRLDQRKGRCVALLRITLHKQEVKVELLNADGDVCATNTTALAPDVLPELLASTEPGLFETCTTNLKT
jgi:hypothetical protein